MNDSPGDLTSTAEELRPTPKLTAMNPIAAQIMDRYRTKANRAWTRLMSNLPAPSQGHQWEPDMSFREDAKGKKWIVTIRAVQRPTLKTEEQADGT